MFNIRRYVSGPAAVSLIAALFAAGSAWVSAIDQDKSKKKLVELQNSLNEKTEIIDKKTQTIISINNKLVELATGGDSDAWILAYASNKNTNEFVFDTINGTSSPVFDLVAFASLTSEIPGKPGLFVGGPSIRWIIGNVAPNGIQPGEGKKFRLVPNRRNKLSIVFKARNGGWTQNIFFVPDRSGWLTASYAAHYPKDGGRIIYEYRSDNFPQSGKW